MNIIKFITWDICLVHRSLAYRTWLGLSDSETEGVFRWQNGYVLETGEWQNYHPANAENGNCVYSGDYGILTDADCDTTYSYICEHSKGEEGFLHAIADIIL